MQSELTELKSKTKVTSQRGRATLLKIIALLLIAAAGLVYFSATGLSQSARDEGRQTGFDRQISDNAQEMIAQGKQIFRYDTFGDEVYWTDKLKLQQAIQGSKFGGVGPGVSPKAALAVGLKVDMDALPAELVEKIKKGLVDLDDPATTLALPEPVNESVIYTLPSVTTNPLTPNRFLIHIGITLNPEEGDSNGIDFSG